MTAGLNRMFSLGAVLQFIFLFSSQSRADISYIEIILSNCIEWSSLAILSYRVSIFPVIPYIFIPASGRRNEKRSWWGKICWRLLKGQLKHMIFSTISIPSRQFDAIWTAISLCWLPKWEVCTLNRRWVSFCGVCSFIILSSHLRVYYFYLLVKKTLLWDSWKQFETLLYLRSWRPNILKLTSTFNQI